MKNIIILGIVVACIWLIYQYPHEMLTPGVLVEGHQDLNDKCFSCHRPFWGISNDKCISCHKLSEIGKNSIKLNDTTENILFHQNFSNQNCTACHTDHRGIKPEISLSSFSHDLLSEEVINKCNSCHSKPADNIHQSIIASCNSCHNTKGWTVTVTFNHDMIQGADKNNCSSCHQKPTDSFHHLFKDNCGSCHTTNEWLPSSFDHANYFLLDDNHNAQCNICHTNNDFGEYTCYGCHEHSQNNIIAEHNEEGIFNIANCASCHKSGNEDDIRMNGNSGRELNQDEINNERKYIKSQEKNNKKERDDKKDDDDN